MCFSNFAQFVSWCRQPGVSVGGVIFKVVMVAALSEVPPDPGSHDQFWAMVVQ